jgi:hypothetical protein
VSLLSRHAGRPDIAPVLVQNHCDDLPSRIAYEGELRIDDLVKELILGVRENWKGGLPGKLCVEMITLPCDIEYAETELVFTDIFVERGGTEIDLPKLGREFGRA